MSSARTPALKNEPMTMFSECQQPGTGTFEPLIRKNLVTAERFEELENEARAKSHRAAATSSR